ncbi:unnamed protein product [Prunus armeniaca]
MLFPKFWTQSDIDWSMKSDYSGSLGVRFEMQWLVYCIVLAIGFHSKPTKSLLPPYYVVPQRLHLTQNQPNDSSHHVMLFPKFWTQSDIDWPMKSDYSGSKEVRSEMEWLVYCIVLAIGFHSKPTKSFLPPHYVVPQCLVYCIVLAIGFHSKPTKSLLPPYYVVPQVLDSIRYRLVHEIGLFRFIGSSF